MRSLPRSSAATEAKGGNGRENGRLALPLLDGEIARGTWSTWIGGFDHSLVNNAISSLMRDNKIVVQPAGIICGL